VKREKILAYRYADGLFLYCREKTKEKSKLLQYLEDVKLITKYLKENPDLYKIIMQPNFEESKKISLFNSTLKNLIVNKDLFDFYRLLIEKHRINLYNEIANEFEKLIYKQIRKIKITIESAEKLNENLLKKIKEKFEKYFQKEVELILKINKQLIGGCKIYKGSEVYDCSILTYLNEFKQTLLRSGL